MSSAWYILVAVALGARGDDITGGGGAGDDCGPWVEGPWGALLEDWATSGNVTSHRHGRIMVLPSGGYYVTDRIDGPLVPPPPPLAAQEHQPGRPQYGGRAPPASKIVNRPGPYKDKPYRPAYSAHTGPPIPVQSAVDRVDETPHRQVSETDLYLLGAIEKLVYRVDLMEKRLRKMEEAMHYMVAGAEPKPDPCPGSFSRVGPRCYHLSRAALNWKGASLACRKLHAALLELDDDRQREQLQHALLADDALKGVDWWTGGLNPGLLWIWSHSARPVGGNNTAQPAGDGRCLALAHDTARRTYTYRGEDCGLTHRYVCELSEDKSKLSNEVQQEARAQAGLAPTHSTTSSNNSTTSNTGTTS